MAKSDIDKTHEAFLKLSQSHTSWLIKNTGSIIALTVVIATFGLWYVMLMGLAKGVGENILFAINGGLTTTVGFILSFYFGTSKTEADAKRQSVAMTSSGDTGGPVDLPQLPIPAEADPEPAEQVEPEPIIPEAIKDLVPDKVKDIITKTEPILEKAGHVGEVATPILEQVIEASKELSNKNV